jgi:uncharacterized protein involved in exopolysaccharide biosynthesis/Mrp family chromosome partitioning ATPase
MKDNIPELFESARVAEGRSLTARDVLTVLFKHKWVIFLCLVLVAGLVGAGLYRLPESYASEAKLLIKTEQEAGPVFYSGIAAYREGRDTDPPNRKMETELELLSTRAFSADVVRSLDLQYDQVYHAPLTVLRNALGDALEWVQARYLHRTPQPRYGREATVREFNKSFTVKPLKSRSNDTTSNLMQISLRAPDPDIAQGALDALLENYLAYAPGMTQRSADRALQIVSANVVEAEKKVEQAQQRLNRFITERGVVLARPGGPARFASMPAEPQEDGPDAMRGASGAPRNLVPEVGFGDDGALLALKSRLTQLEMQLAEVLLNYTDDNSRVGLLRSQIGELRGRVQGETRRNAQNDTGLMSLQRELRIAEETYLDVKRRMNQIALFREINPAHADTRIVVDAPLRPTQSDAGRKILLWIAAAVAGLFLGLAVAGALELADHRLSSPGDVLRYLGLPTLGALGFVNRHGRPRGRRAAHAIQNAAFRLCAQLDRADRGNPGKAPGHAIVVTSARPGEGKSVIARLLSQELARISCRDVWLIDANLERPKLHRVYDLPQDSSFSEGLVSGTWDGLEGHCGPVPGMRVLTAAASGNGERLQRIDALAAFYSHIGRRGTLAIILAPSLQTGGQNIAQRADGIVLVVDASRTRREVVAGMLEDLGLDRSKFLGVILNKRRLHIPGWLYRFL